MSLGWILSVAGGIRGVGPAEIWWLPEDQHHNTMCLNFVRLGDILFRLSRYSVVWFLKMVFR